MATYSSILAWKIPWPEEPVRLESRGRKKLDTAEWLSMHPTLNLLSPFPAPPHPLTHHRSYLQAHPSVYMCRHFPLFRQVRRQRSPLLCRADIFSAFLLITSWSQTVISLSPSLEFTVVLSLHHEAQLWKFWGNNTVRTTDFPKRSLSEQ